ncbi:LysR family transcriptional regulator [Burkholderia gladioli]|uniref:LysR family transcriptional regulator n=1 Tax=Burkholderia gladioli TaxID=28095 RepID=UPI00163E6EAF|nr:LysR family transcriptional regulator [Burkholderia gladioli]
MDDFTLRELNLLAAINTQRSIRKAALKLEISPAFVSKKLKSIEDRIGGKIFERFESGVKPTEIGNWVIQYAAARQGMFTDLAGKLDTNRAPVTGRIRIACSEGMVTPLSEHVVWPFMRTFPTIEIRMDTRSSAEIVEDVAQDRADIGFAYNPPARDGVVWHASASHKVVVAAHPEHPVASLTAPIKFSRAVSYPFATMPAEFGIGSLVDSIARGESIRFKPALTSNTLRTLKDFARSGLGIAFVTDYSIREEVARKELVSMPVDHSMVGLQHLRVMVRAGHVLSSIQHEFLLHVDKNDWILEV